MEVEVIDTEYGFGERVPMDLFGLVFPVGDGVF